MADQTTRSAPPVGPVLGRDESRSAALILAALTALIVALAHGGRWVAIAAGILIVVSFVAASYRMLTQWYSMIAAIGLVILFIPIKRYSFAGASLPFDLEPYRVGVAVVVLLWLSSALIDPKVALRRGGLEKPLFLFLFAVVASIVTNLDRINKLDVAPEVAKQLLFLLSFVLVYYMTLSLIRTPADIDRVLKVFVAGTAAVAVAALIERRTHYNVFNHLHPVLPFLTFNGALSGGSIVRAGNLRVYGSAQHPIALAALFVIVLPLAIYLARRTGRKAWSLAALLITFGALATVSRTSVTMLAAAGIVVLRLRPIAVKRLIPLILPGLIVLHFALPGVIGGIREAFFPRQGLIANQQKHGGRFSSARLDPQFKAIGAQPAFGVGYGTRQTTGPKANARILDDEWLGTTVETGIVGLFAWIWIFVRFIRRIGREARKDASDRGWLLTAMAASACAFAVGMLTYDAFSFIQVTYALFIILALGSATALWDGAWPPGGDPRARARARRRASAH